MKTDECLATVGYEEELDYLTRLLNVRKTIKHIEYASELLEKGQGINLAVTGCVKGEIEALGLILLERGFEFRLARLTDYIRNGVTYYVPYHLHVIQLYPGNVPRTIRVLFPSGSHTPTHVVRLMSKL